MLSAASQPEGHYDAVVLVSPAVFLRVAGPRPWQALRRLQKRLPRSLVSFGRTILRTMVAAFFSL